MRNNEQQSNTTKERKKRKIWKYINKYVEEEGEGQVRLQSGFAIRRWDEPENDSLSSFGAKCHKKKTKKYPHARSSLWVSDWD